MAAKKFYTDLSGYQVLGTSSIKGDVISRQEDREGVIYFGLFCTENYKEIESMKPLSEWLDENDTPYPSVSDLRSRNSDFFKPVSGGSGTPIAVAPTSHTFEDAAARDAYFTTNSSELLNNELFYSLINVDDMAQRWVGEDQPSIYDNTQWIVTTSAQALSDWNETDTTSPAYIQNKPYVIPQAQALELIGGGFTTLHKHRRRFLSVGSLTTFNLSGASATPSYLQGLTEGAKYDIDLFDTATGAFKNVSNETLTLNVTVNLHPSKSNSGAADVNIAYEKSIDNGASYQPVDYSWIPLEIAANSESYQTKIKPILSVAPNDIIRVMIYKIGSGDIALESSSVDFGGNQIVCESCSILVEEL